MTLSEVYTDEEAGKAIESSKAIINKVKSILDIETVKPEDKNTGLEKKRDNASKRKG